MIRSIKWLIAIGFVFLSISACADDSKKEAAALSAAEQWLMLIDSQQYADSWKEAATLFRNAVKPKQWEHSMITVREPLGELVSRKVKTINYTSSLPGAPDGEYVVIQFNASFQNKKKAVETVTPMMDKDGMWRVSGYYIK